MTATLAPGIAACHDRLDLVDAAFGSEQRATLRDRRAREELQRDFCPGCDVAAACVALGRAEHYGFFGGASGKARTKARRRPC